MAYLSIFGGLCSFLIGASQFVYQMVGARPDPFLFYVGVALFVMSLLILIFSEKKKFALVGLVFCGLGMLTHILVWFDDFNVIIEYGQNIMKFLK